eukprot:2431187-Rhodomonas_salina.2
MDTAYESHRSRRKKAERCIPSRLVCSLVPPSADVSTGVSRQIRDVLTSVLAYPQSTRSGRPWTDHAVPRTMSVPDITYTAKSNKKKSKIPHSLYLEGAFLHLIFGGGR